MLEKKLDVMTKARTTDSKKVKMTETELREEINGLRQMLSDVQSDAKVLIIDSFHFYCYAFLSFANFRHSRSEHNN